MAVTTKTFQPGSVFFYENDRSREMYIIQQGRVNIYRTEKGQKVPICEMGKGGIVGEMSLLDGRARSATVEALEETEVAVVTPEEFEKRAHSIPDWYLGMIRILSARLREVDRKLKASLDEEITANVASLLAMMLNKRKTGDSADRLSDNSLDLKTAKNETMEILSLKHDKVSAALKEMETLNLLSTSNNILTINDKSTLALYAKYKRGIEVDPDVVPGHPLSENAIQVLKLLCNAAKSLKTDKNGDCEISLAGMGSDANMLFSDGDFLKELVDMDIVTYDEKKLLEAKPKEMGKVTVNRRKAMSLLASAIFGAAFNN